MTPPRRHDPIGPVMVAPMTGIVAGVATVENLAAIAGDPWSPSTRPTNIADALGSLR